MTALPLAETIPVQLSDLDVFLQNVRPRLAGENVAELVHRYELRPASRLRVGIAALIQNEGVHESRSRISDPDALLPTRIVDAVRFGVGHIDLVLVVEGDAAWGAELRPRESMAMPCSVRNSPGAYPVLPHALMNLPSFENFITRLLPFTSWPSAMKMSPLAATATELGEVKWA